MRSSQLGPFNVNVTYFPAALLLIKFVILDEGSIYTARILVRSDLDRQIVRSPTCEIIIPEYELTLPATTRGQLTTVEGLIRDVVSDLSMDQPVRRIQDYDGYTKIQVLLDRLTEILDEDGKDADVDILADNANKAFPAFTIKLDDPAGNSWIEFIESIADPKWNMRTYPRTYQHNVTLGLVAPEELQQVQALDTGLANNSMQVPDPVTADEVFVFPGHCSSCGHPLDTLMKKVNIPYFKVSYRGFIVTYNSPTNS
jgi:zinc finger protein